MSNTSLIIRALIFLGLLGGFCFVVYDISRARESADSARASIVSEESRGANAQVTKQFLESTEQQRAQAHSFYVPANGTADALSLVEQLARAAKVEARVTGADLTKIQAQYLEELSVTLNVRGPFTNVLSLVTMLESLPRVSNVRSVSIEVTEGGVWSGSIVAVFTKSKLQ